MTVLADTGALFALTNRTDEWHGPVRRWWLANREPILVPVTVVPEVAYLLAAQLGAAFEAAFIRSLAAGELPIEPLEFEDVGRAAELLDVYRDLPLGLVDASLVAMAERLGIVTLLTTDRRHFGVVRPAHVERLRLLP